jgi:uncharacterized protein YoxC
MLLTRPVSIAAALGPQLLRGPGELVAVVLALPGALERLNRTLEEALREVTTMRRGVEQLVVQVDGLREDFRGIRAELGEVQAEVAPMRVRVDDLADRVGRLPFARRGQRPAAQ